MSLLDSIKQGGGTLRKVTPPDAGARKSAGGARESVLDAIKRGSNQLRKVTVEDQEAAAEEKKRNSSMGGFGEYNTVQVELHNMFELGYFGSM